MAYNPVVPLLFWLLAAITLCNLGGFVALTFGFSWPVTLGLLFCCLVLCLFYLRSLRSTLGTPGFLIVMASISYLLIGISSAELNGYAWYTVDTKLPFRVVLSVLIVAATAVGAYEVLRRIGAERLLKGVMIVLILACILVIASPWLNAHVFSLSRMPNADYLTSFTGRSSGAFQSPNSSGEVGCYTIALSLSLLVASRYQKLAFIGLILGVGTVVLSMSRSAILVSALIFPIALWWSLANKSRGKLNRFNILLSIALVVGLIALVLANLEYFYLTERNVQRMRWIMSFGQAERTYDRRSMLWESALHQIGIYPFAGSGILRFHFLDERIRCLGTGRVVPCGVHNTYLMLWGEAGIVPPAFLLSGLGYLLWKSLTLRKCAATATIGGATFIFMMSGMVATDTLIHIWHNFMLGVVLALTTHMIFETGPAPRRRTMRRPLPAASQT